MIWKDIKGYEGLYKISEFGDIKALETTSKRKLKQGLVDIIIKEKMMKPSRITKKSRYKKIRLSRKDSNAIYEVFMVHRLVYEAFIGELNDSYVVDHIDGNRDNNHYSNLQLITQQENIIKHFNDYYNDKLFEDGKICCRCKLKKPLTEFYKVSVKSGTINEYRGHCKKCH